MTRSKLALNGLYLVIFLACASVRVTGAGCPVIDNPSQMFQCLTINPQAFVDLISKNDYKSFCHMANGYMTCMTTYLRDCLGGKALTGVLEELQDLNLKCCISGRSQECILRNPNFYSKCFSFDNTVTLANGESKSIRNIAIGDVVKAVDSAGNRVNTEIVDIMHKSSDSATLFQEFYDTNQNSISLSSSHLIYVQRHGYIKAASVQIGDKLRFYKANASTYSDFEVRRIDFNIKEGFVAPLTREGTLLVNGVDASCYAEINNHKVADLAMAPVKLWYVMSKYVASKKRRDLTEPESSKDMSFYSLFLQKIATHLFPSYLN